MTTEQKIRKALADKGWAVSEYRYERPRYYSTGAEYGYEIDLVLDEYPELDAAPDGGVMLLAEYYHVFDRLQRHLTERTFATNHKEFAECSNGFIWALNLSNVMYVIDKLPNRYSIDERNASPMSPHSSTTA